MKSFELDDENEAHKLISGISNASVAYLGMLASLIASQNPSNQEEFEQGRNRLIETQRSLQNLRELLTEHSKVSVDKALSSIWRHVLQNLETLQDRRSKLTKEEIEQVKQKWVGVSEAVDGMGRVLLAGLSWDLSFPGHMAKTADWTLPLSRPPDEIPDVFGVMHDIQQDFKNVRKQFRDLLNVPQLQLLQVVDPFRIQSSAERIEQHTEVDPSRVDLMQVILRFNKVKVSCANISVATLLGLKQLCRV